MTASTDDVWDLVGQLPGVEGLDHTDYTQFRVTGHGFGYLWPRTRTLGLKQPVAEQIALVAERPDVFEVQFTTESSGWVVVHLDGVDRDELAELVFEAWRLTAPARLLQEQGDRLPR